MRPELRRATVADAGVFAALTAAGFESYRSFAPEGWEPRPPTLTDTAERLARAGTWGVVAEVAGSAVGVGAFEPARADVVEGLLIGDLAHIWAVFVVQEYWGDGTATEVLRVLTEEMREEEFREGRLYTPAGQARARRFYAREGWTEQGGPSPAPLGLELVELRRAL
jgi:GNAT superfamily N-acetyltransferase